GPEADRARAGLSPVRAGPRDAGRAEHRHGGDRAGGPMAPSATPGVWRNRCESPPGTGRPPWSAIHIEYHDRGSSMKRKEYEKALRKLQVKLCALQDWVKQKGLRVVVIFEGRDSAGKGGTIKAITERVSPRVFRVVALPA